MNNSNLSNSNTNPEKDGIKSNGPNKHVQTLLLVIIILLIIIISAMAYLLLQSRDKVAINSSNDSNIAQEDQTQPTKNTENTKEENKVTSNNKTTDKKVSKDISEAWLNYTNSEFKIKLPDGWKFTSQDKTVLYTDCSLDDADCYKVTPGTRATVEEVSGGRGGVHGVLVTIQPVGYGISEITQGYDFVKKINGDFRLYQKIQTTDPGYQGPGDDLPKGTVEYIAVKGLSDGRTAYMGYTVTPVQSDPIDTINLMIDSFQVI